MESIEKVVDFHTHIGDIINGLKFFNYKEKKPGRSVLFLFELMRYRNPFGTIPGFLEIPLAVEIQNRHAWSTKEKLISSMKKNGITACVVHPIEPITSTEEVLKEIDGKILIPFASVSPSDPQKETKLREYVKRGCKGVKLHPILQRTPPEAKEYMELIEEVKSLKVPVLFHTGTVNYFVTRNTYSQYGKVERFESLIKNFPEVKFILAHMALESADLAIEMAEKYRNLYLDTSFQPLKKIIKAIDRIGERRLLFASDWPSSFQETPLLILKKLKKHRPSALPFISYRNAEEILGSVV